MSGNVSAILLTWNPKKYNEGGDGSEDFKSGLSAGTNRRWSCNTTKVNVGDAVYLVRLGIEPRGIVAKGVITKVPFTAEDWADSSKEKRYIEFLVEDLREDCVAGLLPMSLLNAALPAQHWSTQTSGIAIRDDVLPALTQLWHDGKGKHSLRQFTDWCTMDRMQAGDDWLRRYDHITGLMRDIRDHKLAIDGDTLREIWKEAKNGLAFVAQGAMSPSDFEGNLELLTSLTENICANPGAETVREVLATWTTAKAQGKIGKIYRSVIHRAFAAAAPELYTTIVNENHCRELLSLLEKQFQLRANAEFSDDWLGANSAIISCMRQANLARENTLQNNIAMWKLLEYSNKRLSMEDAGEADSIASHVDQATQGIHMSPAPLNQILYGPPGTGKTYATIDEALRILEPELLATPAISRGQLLAAFDRYRSEGQIVFCTFHQSFSYEDFVEGLRAFTENGAVNYRVEDGVLKKLCLRASLGRTAASDPFDNALSRLKEQLEGSDGRLVMSTTKGNKFAVEYDGGDTFKVFPQSSAETQKYDYRANMNLVRQLYQTGSKEGIYNVSYVDGMLIWLKDKCGLPPYQPIQTAPEQQDKFVLIIDEINRGNISRIFGELITLIEPSKRAGIGEGLEALLPYSKKMFSVPSNLYLIGTMNTADRSLAGLDIALRRRFTFKEMPPQPKLLKDIDIGGVNVGGMLDVMNQRIEVLLDRDHCLGHAYFISLRSGDPLEKLSSIFRQQILPLLQEYFFEDWELIAWVLNDQNKPSDIRFLQKKTIDLAYLFGSDVAGTLQNSDRCWQINKDAFRNIESYRGILGDAA
jgi:5-methylcytosine-specific restriction enzyme B